ncbi:MAG: MetQ/NlpA family ABC transporter substrate-binding protein [Anaerotignum sp.]
MKKIFRNVLTATIASSLLLATACGSSSAETEAPATDDTANAETTKLVVGATAVPHAEILNLVKEDLLAEGIELEVTEFTDYALLNPSTTDGSLDANFFQHTPFLDNFNANSDSKLVSVGPIHIEPLAVYSEKITSLDELKDGDKISIPNDDTNEARALLLLEDNGIIKVKDRNAAAITPIDIVENPLNIEFVELDSAQLPRTINEVAVSVINTNFALTAGYNPIDNSIVMEDGANSPYANILVVKEGRENEEAIQKLYAALTSEKVKTFIEANYEGAVIPAF